MSLYRYPVTVSLIPNLPRIPYRNGVGNYEGVVIHYTDTSGDNAINEHKYETNHWQDAFLHEFIDAKTCLVQADKNYICWGCGPHGNQRYYQIEMCDASSQEEFNQIFDRTCLRAAEMLFERRLEPVDNVTIRSHRQISEEWPQDTNHTDPDAYLAKWGYNWSMLVERVQRYYAALVQEASPQPVQHPPGNHPDDWKTAAVALAKQRGIIHNDHDPKEPVDFGTLCAALNNLYEKLGGK